MLADEPRLVELRVVPCFQDSSIPFGARWSYSSRLVAWKIRQVRLFCLRAVFILRAVHAVADLIAPWAMIFTACSPPTLFYVGRCLQEGPRGAHLRARSASLELLYISFFCGWAAM